MHAKNILNIFFYKTGKTDLHFFELNDLLIISRYFK